MENLTRLTAKLALQRYQPPTVPPLNILKAWPVLKPYYKEILLGQKAGAGLVQQPV